MDPNNTNGTEVEFDFPPIIRTYKNGRVERLFGTAFVPPSPSDPATGVASKDVQILPDSGVSARLFLPKDVPEKKKLPVLVYCHGGAFCIESPFSPGYHHYLNSVVSHCGVVAVSVDYRLAPEHPLPAAYHDSWAALQWVASHAAESGGPEPWLNDHADFGHVFLAGDSAGANICHWLAINAGVERLAGGVEIEGVVLVHPYFWGKEPVGAEPTDPVEREKLEKTWKFVYPSSTNGTDDPWANPAAEGAPSLAGLACKRVLVCVGEEDFLKHRGVFYYEKLKESGWVGELEFLESKGENHVFHLFKPTCEKAVEKMGRLASFFGSVQ